ncbi:MAG: 3-phosphoglycerate dehydrogenase [Saprospiraceae bacterium]|nr:3-phosphoglycerate dehydrogenase [Saprospiraceae bacterium]HMW39957.1 NAD(P)-dependent oxidoreductase [Saprospiraceae bacterium]HMX88661.1 NAD(P)-dependent oxidoreductase [Saprospiraceae bacterium]HMZ41282.1 NAD(P)-dependent oxidoreductase [Saprospiraceae bacterium]HNA65485.1 NAD(P)-dependent oxidoreductase [Saprospiraceae bacterium]
MANWNILINDGLEKSGVKALEEAGINTDLVKKNQEDLAGILNNYQGIIVRSATKVRKEHIDAAPGLQFIARAGVGLDNVDAEYARSKGIEVINTPGASSRSVAELAMAHLLCLTRSLHRTNRELNGADRFNSLKKELSSSGEVRAKTLVLLGFGRIGSELARMAWGLGMKIVVVDPFIQEARLSIDLGTQSIEIELPVMSREQALPLADYLSLHAPFTGECLMGKSQFELLQPHCLLVNTSRGENIDESALLEALNNGQLAGAGLDVFHQEPQINPLLLQHPRISVSPHIAASTREAQERIALELVDRVLALYHIKSPLHSGSH